MYSKTRINFKKISFVEKISFVYISNAKQDFEGWLLKHKMGIL